MARRRYGRRYRRTYKVQKYSNETSTGVLQYEIPVNITPPTEACTVIDNINAQGMRKVKNFSFQCYNESAYPVAWALVYIPEGTRPSALGHPTDGTSVSLYEPNQNVILSGVIQDTDGIVTKRTRLARNLNSGDCVVLVVSSIYSQPTPPTPPEPEPAARSQPELASHPKAILRDGEIYFRFGFVCNYAITF